MKMFNVHVLAQKTVSTAEYGEAKKCSVPMDGLFKLPSSSTVTITEVSFSHLGDEEVYSPPLPINTFP